MKKFNEVVNDEVEKDEGCEENMECGKSKKLHVTSNLQVVKNLIFYQGTK